MVLSSLRLKDFRNYTTAELSFCDRINFIHGLNGQGKTSILEAIYYLSLSKSFRTQDDTAVIRFEEPFFDIEGSFLTGQRSLENHVRIIVHRTDGKSVLLDKTRLERLADLVGRFPSVVSAPEDVLILSGPPSGRRRWLDIAISQVHAVYLKDLQIYRQALRQRNALLLDANLRYDSLDVWDRELCLTGARLMTTRKAFVAALRPYVINVYSGICEHQDTVDMSYRSSVDFTNDDTAEKDFLEQLRAARARDIQRGTSTVGPHKDEVLFKLDGRVFKDYASQGQFKTMAVAMKFAEFLFMKEKHDRMPLLLLDDVFSELDAMRRGHLMAHLVNAGQVFITSTESWDAHFTDVEMSQFRVAGFDVTAEA